MNGFTTQSAYMDEVTGLWNSEPYIALCGLMAVDFENACLGLQNGWRIVKAIDLGDFIICHVQK